jgi:threonine dehydrogenase-like Zn-dependent dehydrogenase
MRAAELASWFKEGERVEVLGTGEFADQLRTALGERCAVRETDLRPAVIVELTGRAQSVADALRRVADLGTVVLAGPAQPAPVQLDLYSDVHVRSLTVIGVSLSGSSEVVD